MYFLTRTGYNLIMAYTYEHPIGFKNSDCRDVEKIKAAFLERNMVVVDVSWECHGMWTWALIENGSLWCLDKSHGGGGRFAKDSS